MKCASRLLTFILVHFNIGSCLSSVVTVPFSLNVEILHTLSNGAQFIPPSMALSACKLLSSAEDIGAVHSVQSVYVRDSETSQCKRGGEVV